MFNLLQLEWKKVKGYTTFRVLFLLYAILLPSMLLVIKRLPDVPSEFGSKDVFFMFPTVWNYLGYAGNWLVFFFLGFLAVLSISTEINNKTLRQNIITGLSRAEVFQAKVSYIVALSLAATLYYVLVAMLIGVFNTETIYMVKVWQEWDMIPRYFLMCLGYTSLGLLISLLVKRTGIALFLYLSYVMFIELIIRWAIHKNIVSNKSMHFYPMNAVEDLTPFPLLTTTSDVVKGVDFDILLTPNEAMLTTTVYIGIFWFLSYYILEKKSL